jgi:hypothetical protein
MMVHLVLQLPTGQLVALVIFCSILHLPYYYPDKDSLFLIQEVLELTDEADLVK